VQQEVDRAEVHVEVRLALGQGQSQVGDRGAGGHGDRRDPQQRTDGPVGSPGGGGWGSGPTHVDGRG
jgi:hypothetical protein